MSYFIYYCKIYKILLKVIPGISWTSAPKIIKTLLLKRSVTELPLYVSAATREADVGVSDEHLAHSHECGKAATEAVARVATMPGITERMFGEGYASTSFHSDSSSFFSSSGFPIGSDPNSA